MKLFLVFVVTLLPLACVGRGVEPRPSKQPTAIMVPAGTQIPALALAFDVSYDPKTDGVVPKYRILTVGITNNSLEVTPLDLMTDRWWIVDRRGKRHQAVLSLRRTDPDTFAALPIRLKKLLEYPLLVPMGTTQPIDLLFPEGVRLSEFREVIFRNDAINREIHIYPRE